MLVALATLGLAQIAPECENAAASPPPDWYVDDQAQQDFLLNYFALSTTLSPQHPPVPTKPGHLSVGADLAIIPPLNCDRRLVLDRSKTEDTNKTPIAPRIRALFASPKFGDTVVYGGLAYIPPVTVFGTTNVIASGELGVGVQLDKGWQFGGRYHYTLLKTVAEIATPFNEEDPAVLDFYSGSTFGLDAMFGRRFGDVDLDGTEKGKGVALVPYLALGFTDASTFFYIGDDAVVSNNLTPYFGFTGSLGAQLTWRHLETAAEFYTAPGYLYTGRLRVAYRF